MISAEDAARFFAIATSRPHDMTNMKANKLVYYAQAWSLVRFGHPLFNERIEAWEHGPVIPSVFNEYKPYGKEPIPVPSDTSFLNRFSDSECQLLFDVIREYDCLSAWQLRNLSHSDGEPWKRVYVENAPHIEISRELIAQCFEAKEPLPEVPLTAVFSQTPVVDALPADWAVE